MIQLNTHKNPYVFRFIFFPITILEIVRTTHNTDVKNFNFGYRICVAYASVYLKKNDVSVSLNGTENKIARKYWSTKIDESKVNKTSIE